MHKDQRGPVCLRGCYIRSDRWERANAGRNMWSSRDEMETIAVSFMLRMDH